MTLPQYTKKDILILAVTMPLVVVLINALLFGTRYFTDRSVFWGSSLVVLTVMSFCWIGFTWIAVTVRNRFPPGSDSFRRLAVTVLFIGLIQALVMTLFFKGYSQFNLFGYEFNEARYYWTLGIGFLLNILITMLHEGFDRFEQWKTTLTETEKLKTAYAQSQLMGLKSQVNPHFLFNSLNSLSSLINEDSEKAEKFLDELTKVYRYLLRSPDDKLVPLDTELQFIDSYYYLLKARYGERVNLKVNLDAGCRVKYVSPFLLQTVFEYSINNNALQKDKPLNFLITQDNNCRLVIQNNLQQKQTSIGVSTEGLRNLVEKYKLLCCDEAVQIAREDDSFTIRVPLLTETDCKRS